MGLVQNAGKIVQNIVKHPLETALILTLSTAISCKSLDNLVIDNSQNSKKQSVAIEKVIEQDLEKLPGDYSPRYNTTTHKLMQMEKEFGANSLDYLLLDILIDRQRSEFDIKRKYDFNEIIDKLKDIGEMLRPFQIEPEESRSSLVSKCLEDMRLDCDSLSLVYLAIGEKINLPIQLAVIPWHVYIKVDTKQGPIYWNASMVEDNKIITNDKYIGKGNIDNWPKILDTQGVFALHYTNLSSEWLNKYHYYEWQKNKGIEVDEEEGITYLQKGLNDANKAIELFPEMFTAYYNKGEILFCMQDYNNSLEAFKEADSLWHNEAHSLIGQGKNYYQLSEYDKALEVLTNAIEINPILMKAYHLRAKVWNEKGKKQKALDDLKMALELMALGMK